MADADFSRTEQLLGAEAMRRLQGATVAVFGIGGVGSYTAEALVRGGIGQIWLIDADTVSPSNVNRQLVALQSTVGFAKVDVMAARAADISPHCTVRTFPLFYDEQTADRVPLQGLTYVVDAIDTVSSKLLLAERCAAAGVPEISCMGAGNKLDPMRFEVADIARTSVCPLARAMRTALRKRGIEHLKVVYSKEPPVHPPLPAAEAAARPVPGSVSFVPSVAGLLLAAEVIRDIVGSGAAERS